MRQSCWPLSRRDFGLALCGLPFSLPLSARDYESMPWNGPSSVAKLYLASPKVYWPKPTLDVAKEIQDIEFQLAEVQRKNAEYVRLVGGEVIRTDEDARAWLATTGDIDGVLIIPITQPIPA